MLVTRQCDTGQSIWSSSKLGAFHQDPASPRMSSREQLKSQQDWREQYSQYLHPSNNALLSSHFGQVTELNGTDSSSAQHQFASRPHLRSRHSLAHLENGQNVLQTLSMDRPNSASANCGQRVSNRHEQDSVDPAESTGQLLTSAPVRSTSPSVKPINAGQEGSQKHGDIKEGEDEEEDDDDEMLDPEDGAGMPQTEAERRAERRKMKRFRLTHQQTRFLMSEFAKQAHPDAAHRERLSREIPGLSPRQVQVWFQNRRAKIKRLTVDDRDRMLKMRAVPDDFDNVQALHSPYGAVQGTGTPLHSPADYTSTYSEQAMMRPLLVDTVRRQENDEQHLSPTGISPAFGHVGLTPPGSIGTSDVLSPLSLNSGDRFYGSHQSSPLSAGPRSATTFNRQTSSDNYPLHPSSRHPRPIQPLQLRETMSRTRSHSLQSPLRTSMSWKGDSLDYADYADYAAGGGGPAITRRQSSQYQPEQAGRNSGNVHHYENNIYSNSNVHASPIDGSYSAPQTASLQSPVNPVPRFRSTSSVFPSGLDFRNQYRGLNTQQMGPPAAAAPTTSHGSNFSNTFAINSTGFASAPLSAPSDFQLPRTPNDVEARHYHMSQLSAPMAPPQDFRNAYNHIISPMRPTQTEALHDQEPQQTQQHITDSSIQTQPTDNPVFVAGESSGIRPGHMRKRTYSMPLQFDGL